MSSDPVQHVLYTFFLHLLGINDSIWGVNRNLGKDVGLDCRGLTLVTNPDSTNKCTSTLLCISLIVISCMFRLNFLLVWNALVGSFLVQSVQTEQYVQYMLHDRIQFETYRNRCLLNKQPSAGKCN